uniref:Uncharacterized protein n=1 Tax=Oryza sativa subsp. japonica TaxID=39947 RepID=Q69JJ8_ORYSJ|nr:hypothetical protein [Oryza sativa Japonica Group]
MVVIAVASRLDDAHSWSLQLCLEGDGTSMPPQSKDINIHQVLWTPLIPLFKEQSCSKDLRPPTITSTIPAGQRGPGSLKGGAHLNGGWFMHACQVELIALGTGAESLGEFTK